MSLSKMKFKAMPRWAQMKANDFSQSDTLPRGWKTLKSKIDKLEAKKLKIYQELEGLKFRLNRHSCPHPREFLSLHADYSTDTLGSNGQTTYGLSCELCQEYERLGRGPS